MDIIKVEYKNKIVFRITDKGLILVNEKVKFTNKELSDAIWKWSKINGNNEDSADWWKK